MKKNILLALLMLLVSSSAGFAKAQMANPPLDRSLSPSGSANQVQNAQQQQNQGEEQNLRIENKLEEGEGEGMAQPAGMRQNPIASGSPKMLFSQGSELAKQKSNEVAGKVQELLLNREFKSGIGEEVRLIAQNQIKAQEKIAGDLADLESRPGWQRFFFGNKQSSIENIELVLDENEARIEELTGLLSDETLSVADAAALEESVLELKAQQTLLEEHLANADGEFSLFGFFRNIFRRNQNN